MQFIMLKTKVLMLSATPVNNRFVDLKNQLAISYEGDCKLINKKLDSVTIARSRKHIEKYDSTLGAYVTALL